MEGGLGVHHPGVVHVVLRGHQNHSGPATEQVMDSLKSVCCRPTSDITGQRGSLMHHRASFIRHSLGT